MTKVTCSRCRGRYQTDLDELHASVCDECWMELELVQGLSVDEILKMYPPHEDDAGEFIRNKWQGDR